MKNFFLAIVIFLFLPFLGGCAVIAPSLVAGVTDVATDAVRENGGIGGLFRKASDFVSNMADNITGNEKKEEVVQWKEPQPSPLRKIPMIFPDKRKIRFVGKNPYVWSEGDPPLPSSKTGDDISPVKKVLWGKGTSI